MKLDIRKKIMVPLLMIGALLATLVTTTAPASSQLPEADIIFVVDESGSMGPYQAALAANIIDVATSLSAVTDGRYGLVGYGADDPTPVTEQPLTDDLTAFADAVNALTTDGFLEPGYDATIHSLSDPAMGRRATAGTCVVLASDEPSNFDTATQQDAIDTLTAEGAFFFGLLFPDPFVTDSYDALATSSGGAIFDLTAFNTDPANVLAALLNTCVEAIVSSGTDVDIHPTSCPNPFRLGKRGVVPAAILGSDTLDVADIDPDTIELTGPGGTATPRRWSINDVAGPDEYPQPELRRDCGTDGPDGFDDLTLKFAARKFENALGPVARGDTVIVTISAQTTDGATLSGVDIVWVR